MLIALRAACIAAMLLNASVVCYKTESVHPPDPHHLYSLASSQPLKLFVSLESRGYYPWHTIQKTAPFMPVYCKFVGFERVSQIGERIRLVSIRTLFYSKPESGMHGTEMILYALFLFNLLVATTIPARIIAAALANSSYIRRFQPRLFSAPEIFTPDVGLGLYGMKNRRRKWESIYGTSFWNVMSWLAYKTSPQ